MPEVKPPNDTREKPKPKPPELRAPDWRALLWYLPMLLVLLWLYQEWMNQDARFQTIPYSEFKDRLAAGEVRDVRIMESEIEGQIVPKPKMTPEKPAADEKPAAKVTGKPPTAPGTRPPSGVKPPPSLPLARPTEPPRFRTVRVEDPKLIEQLQAAGVSYQAERPGVLSNLLMLWVMPILLISVFWWFLSRRMSSAGQAVMSIGKSKARLVADQSTGVTFADVAGCDEAKYELQEVVDFLKHPQRYEKLGAKIPKGILLVGPPGTGKTLMARAVAGEAGVAFFSISGSDFVEMFVGVGAARVRDLFETAKREAPCIIFIDEVDAIGRQRGVHIGPVNDEREQTLNQLLVEMDGFQANVGVIILAATNRPDVLDRALLRPGRFDRQVVVDSPDVDGREAILRVHARGKPLAADIDLRAVAKATVGFSGADLANALNEAALLAARRVSEQITQGDLEQAVEKLVAGPERTSRRLDDVQRRRVAFHEVGHALVAAYSEHVDPVHKISIVPRGRAALGYTLQLPVADQFLMTKSDLLERIRGMLGGRAAEELVYAEVSTGAENDLERATALARQMVCMFGMSDAVGLIHCTNKQGEFVQQVPGLSLTRDCSEETYRTVDVEVRKILDQAYQEARQILTDHRDQLDSVAEALLHRETIDAATFHQLIGKPLPPDAKKVPPASLGQLFNPPLE
jgi:cell division protease FtsH